MVMTETGTTCKPDDVILFHVRSMAYMLLLFIGLIVTFFLVLDRQYSINVDHQHQILQQNFNDHADQLDSLLSRVTTWMESMRTKAEFDLFESRQINVLPYSSTFSMLQEATDAFRFHLDDVRKPYSLDMVGNLTGKGNLSGRSFSFDREIRMALNLNPYFQASFRAIQNAAWVYYTSARGFINSYPWVSSEDYRYSDDLLNHEFFLLGTPGKNPDRQLFWTGIYTDEYGKGLMTTCAVPIYDQQHFLGTVALDLTVDFFNRQLRQFHVGGGTIFIVNDRQQLVAHSPSTTSDSTALLSLQDMLAPFPGIEANTMQLVPENRLTHDGGYLILRYQLHHAPWQVYFLLKPASKWHGYLHTMGIGDFTLIIGMGILMAAIFLNTHFRFILPSGKLVQFIMDQGISPLPPLPKKIPTAWLPWFKKISNTFSDNERLAREIRQQNEMLEKRVEERTLELLESNRQLQRESEEHLAAEKEKQQLQSKLQHAQKMEAIGLLAGGVAHDLNNILAGLVSYPQLLLMELEPDSPLRDPIHTIQKAGERSAAIVQDLLSLARRGVTTTEVVFLNDLICNYIGSPECRRLASSHPAVEIETDLAADLLNMNGSPVHLIKCIMNLVLNAMEAMPEGGRVVVRTANRYVDMPIPGYEEVAEGEYVILQVSDDGVGIQPDEIERIFEPFYTKKVMGRSGTGLGMAVVWGTVKDHQGYIHVRSEPGECTTFSLYFPVTRNMRQAEQADVDLLHFRGKDELILIIDDVVEQREIGSRMLQLLGYRVVTVASGEIAVGYVREHTPDLVVLDMIMEPGMDGYETYRQITAIRPGMKAIITSGFSENEQVRKTMELGAGAYVRKPYRIEKIAVAVRNELDKSG